MGRGPLAHFQSTDLGLWKYRLLKELSGQGMEFTEAVAYSAEQRMRTMLMVALSMGFERLPAALSHAIRVAGSEATRDRRFPRHVHRTCLAARPSPGSVQCSPDPTCVPCDRRGGIGRRLSPSLLRESSAPGLSSNGRRRVAKTFLTSATDGPALDAANGGKHERHVNPRRNALGGAGRRLLYRAHGPQCKFLTANLRLPLFTPPHARGFFIRKIINGGAPAQLTRGV